MEAKQMNSLEQRTLKRLDAGIVNTRAARISADSIVWLSFTRRRFLKPTTSSTVSRKFP
jgi:hypothetical protein